MFLTTDSVKGILMNVSGKLVYKQWDEKVKAIDCLCYTDFKYLALDESGTGYAIASGPTKSSSVIRIQLDTEKVDACAFLNSFDMYLIFW